MDVRWILLPCLLVAVGLTRAPLATAAPVTMTKSLSVENPIFSLVKNELKKLLDNGKAEMGTVTCDVCKIIVGTIKKLYDTNTAWDDIAKLVGDICYWFKIEDEHVCKAIAFEFKASLLLHNIKLGQTKLIVCFTDPAGLYS